MPQCPSAVNLKFLSLLAASSFRNFKFQNHTRIIKLLVVLRFRKFAPERDPSTGELRNRTTSPVWPQTGPRQIMLASSHVH
jgi:hypothetical protein